MTAFERLAARIPGVAPEILDMLLEDAENAICAYTRRAAVPETLEGTLVRLATIYYNRLGVEGESGHSEGGVNRTIAEMPEDIAAQIRPYRIAYAGQTRKG